jgi:hypothetical protein
VVVVMAYWPQTLEERDAIAAHVAMIATYIHRMDVSPSRKRQLASNIRNAILLALNDPTLERMHHAPEEKDAR